MRPTFIVSVKSWTHIIYLPILRMWILFRCLMRCQTEHVDRRSRNAKWVNLLREESSYVSCIHHQRSTSLPLLAFTAAKPFSIYILETCECPWGTLSLSLPFESTHAQASAHTSDRLMNLNRRGFRCLDSSGKKTKQKNPWHPPNSWHVDETVCVCVCARLGFTIYLYPLHIGEFILVFNSNSVFAQISGELGWTLT